MKQPKTPSELDRIVDRVLAYRPKPREMQHTTLRLTGLDSPLAASALET